ncbi:Carbonic anhydrase 6 [Balamuthia mandrillaris]
MGSSSFALLAVLVVAAVTATHAYCYRGHLTSRQEECHWEYEGETGPDNWGTICQGSFPVCASGVEQSPVDLKEAKGTVNRRLYGESFDLEIDWENQEHAVIFHNGHTVEVEVEGGSSLHVPSILSLERQYGLAQFHFHAPSEHTIDGKSFPLEVHFVHTSVDDEGVKLAVVGFLFEEGSQESAFLAQLYVEHNLPVDEESQHRNVSVNFDALFEEVAALDYFHLHGSLTTPPCTEDVMWFVVKSPITATAAQLELFEEVLHHNNRPIQSLNARKLTSFAEEEPEHECPEPAAPKTHINFNFAGMIPQSHC